MNHTAKELKAELEKGVAQLQSLRDEARVRLHLANMDAKARWSQMEPELDAVERAAHEASEASRNALAKSVKLLKEFLASI